MHYIHYGTAFKYQMKSNNTTDCSNISSYATYEDYLDEQVTDRDLYYLCDEELARELVELGYRGSGDTLSRKEFEEKKREFQEFNNKNNLKRGTQQIELFNSGLDLSSNTFLYELAKREELVRNGKLTTIVFIRTVNNRGQEISGYIDYGYRLHTENFRLYFENKKKLKPKPSDLSYYNWETQTANSNPTQNFQVIADNQYGLLFKNKRDRKVINVDPNIKDIGDNSQRYEIHSDEYLQIVIFDHSTRRRM
eukprot:185073_1